MSLAASQNTIAPAPAHVSNVANVSNAGGGGEVVVPTGNSLPRTRDERAARAIDRIHRRTTTHIDQFVQIKVLLSAPRGFSFVVIVHRDQTVQHLVRQVEAEYAFRYLFSPPVFDDLPPALAQLGATRSDVPIDSATTAPSASSYYYLPPVVPTRSSASPSIHEEAVVEEEPAARSSSTVSTTFTSIKAHPSESPIQDRARTVMVPNPSPADALRPRSISHGSHRVSFVSARHKPASPSHSFPSLYRPTGSPSSSANGLAGPTSRISQHSHSQHLHSQQLLEQQQQQQQQQQALPPLIVSQVYGIDTFPIKFTDRVCDVFQGTAGTVFILNEYDDELSTASSAAAAAAAAAVTSTAAAVHVTAAAAASTDEVQPSKSYITAIKDNNESTSETSNDDSVTTDSAKAVASSIVAVTNFVDSQSFDNVLRNKIALGYFALFCIESYSLENLLFWLDVELFQQCPLDARDRYARYIYLTYLRSGAPLMVNIPEDVRNEVPYPPIYLPENLAEIDLSIFDEAQKQVQYILKGNAFARFEHSAYGAQLDAFRNENRDQYAKADYASTGFLEVFGTNYELINLIIQVFDHSSNEKVRERVLEHVSKLPIRSANGELTEEKLNGAFREDILRRVYCRFAVAVSENVDTQRVKGYFSKPTRSGLAARQRRRLKRKKIAKFFGEKPSSDVLEKQVYSFDVVAVASVFDERPSIEFLEKQLFTHADDTMSSMEPSSIETPLSSRRSSVVFTALTREKTTTATRRRRKEKLEDFFGDVLPQTQSESQHLLNRTSASGISVRDVEVDEGLMKRITTPETLPAPLTTNNMTKAQKRLLQRRAKKVSSILGQQIDEHTVYRMTVQAQSNQTTREVPQLTDSNNSSATALIPNTQLHHVDSGVHGVNEAPADNFTTEVPESPSLSLRRQRSSVTAPRPVGMRSRLSSSRMPREGLRSNSITHGHSFSFGSGASNDQLQASTTRQLYRKKLDKVSHLLGERIKVEWLVDGVPRGDQPNLNNVRVPTVKNESRERLAIDNVSSMSQTASAPS